MIETQAQSLIVQAARSRGGFAYKLSNRFLVGVPDLFVKLLNLQPWIWEVKIRDMGQIRFKPGLTGPQEKFLRDYEAAGGNAGVIIVIREKTDLKLIACRYKVLVEHSGFAYYTWARPIVRGHREDCICGILENVE